MIKNFASIAIFMTLSLAAVAQSTEPARRTGRPNIPGTFVLELGVNRLTEKPNELDYGFWGSRTLNVYYQYDMRIANSKFSFHPGIGFGMERFKLLGAQRYLPNDTVPARNPTLMYDANGNTTFVPSANFIYDSDTLGQIDWSGSYSTKKSMLAMNFIDIPVELRFSTRPEDPARSFKIGIGGRVGYLFNAHTKIRYREDGDLKKLKNHQDFNLTRFRYSAFVKVYFGNFSIFSYYNVNPLFESNKGPGATETKSFTVGISLSSF